MLYQELMEEVDFIYDIHLDAKFVSCYNFLTAFSLSTIFK